MGNKRKPCEHVEILPAPRLEGRLVHRDCEARLAALTAACQPFVNKGVLATSEERALEAALAAARP